MCFVHIRTEAKGRNIESEVVCAVWGLLRRGHRQVKLFNVQSSKTQQKKGDKKWSGSLLKNLFIGERKRE